MRLKLLAFFLVWVTTATFVAAQVQDQATINCLHDGYPSPADGTKCICRDGLFTGTRCEKRIIKNDGTLRIPPNQTAIDMGAICPPGFIGANCQPVKCVGGQSQAFYSQPADQMVSFYITYNKDMQSKAETGLEDVVGAICDGFASSGTKQLLYYTPESGNVIFGGNASSCVKSFNRTILNKCDDYDDDGKPIPDDCPSSTSLNFDLLGNLLDSTTPNSELYLVTNYAANNASFSKIPTIIRKAISRRIRIHVFVFPPPYLISENDYVTDPGYQVLRNLAESTLGILSTPYAGVRMGLLGKNTVKDSISAVMAMRENGFVPAAVYSSATGGLKIVGLGTRNETGTYDYYISVRTEDIPRPDGSYYSLNFIQPPEGWDKSNASTVLVDTGNWILYKLTSTKPTIFFSQDTTALKTSVDWVIYTKGTPVLFTAVNDVNNMDASSPYGNMATSAQTLVGSADGTQVIEVSSYTSSFNVTNGFRGEATLSTSIIPREKCQFSYSLGTITCNNQGAIFLQSTYTDGTLSVSPFFCAGTTSSQQTEVIAEFEMIDDTADEPSSDASPCNNGDMALRLAEKTASRAFSIISRNVRYLVADSTLQAEDYSPVDRLYWNPGNIFEYLNDLNDVSPKFYTYYVANLVTNGAEDGCFTVESYLQFRDKLLDKTNNVPVDNTINDKAINWYEALKATTNGLKTNTPLLTYSDIFVVIDQDNTSSLTDGTADMPALFSDLYNTRSRVYFLTVNSSVNRGFIPSAIYNDSINSLSLIAAQTGGGLYRFGSFNDVMEFFKLYFDTTGSGLLGADVVYQKMYDIPNIRQLQTGDIHFPAALIENNLTYWLHLYGTTKALSFTSSCGSDPPLVTTWGEQQRYNLSAYLGMTCRFNIQFLPPYSLGTSFIIYVTGIDPLDAFASIAFTDDVKNNEIASSDPALLKFASDRDQFPVISNENPVSLNINNADQAIFVTTSFNSSICSRPSFPTVVNYNFRCSAANNFYFFYTTFNDTNNATHTRTYVTQCLSLSSGSDKCSNGDLDANGDCLCPPGFSGTICDQRICQNDGQPLISGLCNCTAGFSGEFCENASGQSCVDSPTLPDTRSEVSSILFVVDKAAGLNSISLSSPATLPGIQVSVVQYDCKGANTVLLGSDPTKLSDSLQAGVDTECTADPTDTHLPEAVIQALDSQVSPRALLVLITTGGSPFQSSGTTHKTEILTKLAAQRTDIRIFAINASDTDLQFLATVGNGIVFESTIDKFPEYYTNYVWNVIPRSMVLTTTVAQTLPRLSVVQTGKSTGDPITLTKDIADANSTIYYIHTEGINTVTVDGVTTTPIVSSHTSKITSIVWTDTLNALTITNGTSYSIEKMTTVLLAHGFESSGTNEEIKLGLSYGVQNYLSFYTSRSTLYDTMDNVNFPYVILNQIKNESFIAPSVNYAVTRKDRSCSYNYYTIPIICDESTVGFIAQFVTYTQDSPANERREQKVLLCADAGTFIPAPPPTRGYAFIIDTRGGDPNLFAMSQETVTDFLKAYSADKTFIFLTDQQGGSDSSTDGSGGFVANNVGNVNKAFDAFTQQRILIGDNNYTDPTPAFNTILRAYGDNSYDIQEMFFLTQTGVYTVDLTAVTALTDQNFTLSTVLYIATLLTPDTQSRYDSLSILPGAKTVTNYTKAAVDFLVDNAEPPPLYTVPPITIPGPFACVKKAQAGIFLSFETSLINGASGLSNVTMNQTYAEFLRLFPSDFELGDAYKYTLYPQYSTDPNGCTVNASRFEAQTLISGWSFYGIKMNTQAAILCYNNFPNLANYIKIPSPDRSGTPQWDRISNGVHTYLDQNCMCTRMNDTNTLKIVVWLVFTVPDPTANITYIEDMTDGNNFLHIILAFGPAASDPAGSFYYTLADKSVTKAKDYYGYTGDVGDFFLNATDTSTPDLVSFVYDTICKIQQIDGSRTPTYGNTEYFEEFWRQEALYSENLMRP